MKFGWINLWGSLVVLLMLIPNIIFAAKAPKAGVKHIQPIIIAAEQVGRCGCMLLMVLPVLVWEFGFRSVFSMLLYFGGTSLLLLAYLIIWPFYARYPTRKKALSLAVLPMAIFLLSGILLRHWLLIAAAVAFGAGHIYVTAQNNR